jgi:hypothetical protein
MDTKIKNPITGRWIKVGGAKYEELVKNGTIRGGGKNQSKKMVKKFTPPKDYSVPQKFTKYPVDKSDVKWGEKKPSRVGERRKLMKECGESCFLIPSKLAFPICNKTKPCTYNCRGIKAASSRAGQWKYQKVLEASKKLSEEKGCYKTTKP